MKKVIESFKSIDMYGHPIGVHYKGDDAYRTKLGSFVTLITVGLVLTYSGIRVGQLNTRSNQNETNQTIKLDLDNSGEVNLKENKFNIAFGLLKSGRTYFELPENIGRFIPLHYAFDGFTPREYK